MTKIHYTNGHIYTATRGFIRDFYVDDGIFSSSPVGTAKTVDLRGATVVPGFIDSHTHILPAGLNTLGLDCRPFTSLGDLLEAIADYCSAHAHNNVLFAYAFDETLLREKRFPTQDELRTVTGNLPFFIKRVDMHSMMVNTAFERDYGIESDKGIIRGLEYDAVIVQTQKRFNDSERYEALRVMEQKAYAAGITAIHTMEGYLDDYTAIDFHLKQKGSGIDYSVYPQVMNVQGMKDRGFNRIGGCILIDGSIGSRTAAITGDYSDMPGNNGRLYLNDEDLYAFAEEAHCEGMQLSFHAIGDRAVHQLVNMYDKLLTRHPRNDHRHRIEHAILIQDADFERLAKLGIWLDYQPIFEYFWGGFNKLYHTRLGDTRVPLLHRIRTTQCFGIPFAFGSDCDVTVLNPIGGIYGAVYREIVEEAISVESAVNAFTIDAARIGFKESVIGSIDDGKQADFTILGNDIFSCPKESLYTTSIRAVYKRGTCVFGCPDA